MNIWKCYVINQKKKRLQQYFYHLPVKAKKKGFRILVKRGKIKQKKKVYRGIWLLSCFVYLFPIEILKHTLFFFEQFDDDQWIVVVNNSTKTVTRNIPCNNFFLLLLFLLFSLTNNNTDICCLAIIEVIQSRISGFISSFPFSFSSVCNDNCCTIIKNFFLFVH